MFDDACHSWTEMFSCHYKHNALINHPHLFTNVKVNSLPWLPTIEMDIIFFFLFLKYYSIVWLRNVTRPVVSCNYLFVEKKQTKTKTKQKQKNEQRSKQTSTKNLHERIFLYIFTNWDLSRALKSNVDPFLSYLSTESLIPCYSFSMQRHICEY